MKKLIFRVDHPVLYWLRRILPILLLAGLIAVGALLLNPGREIETPPPPEASAPVETKPAAYRPSWLPEGCEWDRETSYGAETMIVYRTADGTEAVFIYTTDSVPQPERSLGRAVRIGDCPGMLWLGQSKNALNDLFWTDGDMTFWISAPFLEADLIKIAENVEQTE